METVHKHKFSSGTADINLPLHQVLGYIPRQILDWNLSLWTILISATDAPSGRTSESTASALSRAIQSLRILLREKGRSMEIPIALNAALSSVCARSSVKYQHLPGQGVGGLEVSPRPPQLFLDTIITTANGWDYKAAESTMGSRP